MTDRTPRPLLLLVLATTLHAGGDRPLNFRVTEKAARIAPTFVLDLKPGVSHTFETRNLSKGSDTVLVILNDETPLDWNDDRDTVPTDKKLPTESILKFTATHRAPHSIQVRAKDGTLEGECDLYMDGKQLGKRLKFGARDKHPRRHPMEMPRPERTPDYPLIDTYDEERPWR